MISTDVENIGIGSAIQNITAKTKIASNRFSTIVIQSIGIALSGRHKMSIEGNIKIIILNIFFIIKIKWGGKF